MKRCLAIRHLPFEDLGYFENVLATHGFDVKYLDAPIVSLRAIETADADLAIVLGGPVSANDENDYPFLAAELAMLERRLAERRPTLGICLGGQLMARALGAHVATGVTNEIGWIPLSLSESGRNSPVRHFETHPVFHWHGDAFELPDGALSLASTAGCAHQAFSLGSNLLGLQFHPEITAQGLETWYVGHYRALRDPKNPDVATLRQDAARHASELRMRGEAFLTDWLRNLA